MSFNCDQCLHRCKAECCRGPVPIPQDTYERFPVIRPIELTVDLGHGVAAHIAIDRDSEPGKEIATCPFLGLDNKCSIYHDRPEVCRNFGTESNLFMVCSYQSASGRIRPRQEKRWIEREVFPFRENIIARIRQKRATMDDLHRSDRLLERIRSGDR